MPQVFDRKYICKIGRNLEVRENVLPAGSKDYVDRKKTKDTTRYLDRYKSNSVSSNNLTTVPGNVITITDPIHINATIVDPKSGDKFNKNKSVIEFYNLAPETYNFIRTGDSIFLQGGYVQDVDLPHVFIGLITKVSTRKSNTEVITRIEANASEMALSGVFISKSFPKNSTLRDIVNDLAKAIAQSGIPVGEINNQPIAAKLLDKAYPTGFIVQDSPLKALETICDQNGMIAYVTQGRLYVEPKKHRGELTKVVVVGPGQFKGQIEYEKDKKGEELTKEEDFKDNYDAKINLFLDGNITSNCLVRITVKGYEGLYSIKEIQHTMAWKDGDWDTNLTLLRIET